MNYITVEHLPKEFRYNHTRRAIPETIEMYFDDKGGAYIGENKELTVLQGLVDVNYHFCRICAPCGIGRVDSLVDGEHVFISYEAYCGGKRVLRQGCPCESNEWIIEITNIAGALKYFIHESIPSDIVLEHKYPNETEGQ